MTRRIKFLFASVVLALGFFLCLFFLPIGVKAETVEPQIDTTQEVATNEETTETTEQEEVKKDIQTAFDWLKQIDAESVKGWLVAFVVTVGVAALIIAVLVVALILAKTKNYKQTELYNQVVTKMDAEHQKKMEEKADEFNKGLAGLQETLKQEIVKLDDEKKEVARNNIAILKTNLDDIKEDLEK